MPRLLTGSVCIASGRGPRASRASWRGSRGRLLAYISYWLGSRGATDVHLVGAFSGAVGAFCASSGCCQGAISMDLVRPPARLVAARGQALPLLPRGGLVLATAVDQASPFHPGPAPVNAFGFRGSCRAWALECRVGFGRLLLE